MYTPTLLTRIAQGFILLSALALLSISVMAFADPQSVLCLISATLLIVSKRALVSNQQRA
ncbi:hypothetical protein [Spirosoma sp. KUDC1026]|uniref:hypothetical protein n=1 Tax=Spirosoma sp. KUDC1026 TaxID=2745947 RepID=UPI00159B9726|nr:hypothetical protein [Spirosoma sp. KUDC1026]QKZ14300.1 hypothetical protein HU175_17370 [Spirosoma sp. KUDC1026]